MLNNFDLLSNLPLLVFALLFLIVFILFSWAGISLLIARGDPEKTEKGRRLLLTAIWGFFITLVIVLVFYFITFILKKGEIFQAQEAAGEGEFPVSPAINFPSPPQFIKIGSYYFEGPLKLKEYNTIKGSAIVAILCKKDENYDIIFIEDGTNNALLKNSKYNCWLEQCGQEIKNLYVAIFWTSKEIYEPDEKTTLIEELKSEINPPCYIN